MVTLFKLYILITFHTFLMRKIIVEACSERVWVKYGIDVQNFERDRIGELKYNLQLLIPIYNIKWLLFYICHGWDVIQGYDKDTRDLLNRLLENYYKNGGVIDERNSQ